MEKDSIEEGEGRVIYLPNGISITIIGTVNGFTLISQDVKLNIVPRSSNSIDVYLKKR